MEIGPFSWGGNEEQMWRGSWGADSCRDRGLGLHEGTCDCGYRNCLKPQSWGSVWAWEAKLPPLTLDFLISLSLMEPVEQEACGGRGWEGWGRGKTPAAVAAHLTLCAVKILLLNSELYPCTPRFLRRMPRKTAPQRIPTA